MGEQPARLTVDLLTNKGSNRIQINNILSAVCVTALSILLSLNQGREPSAWMVAQLAAAIPCLVTSSLAYATLCYRQESAGRGCAVLGWLTHSAGYIMILNATAILLYRTQYRQTSWPFLGVHAFVFVLYSVLDIVAKRQRLGEQTWKLGFYLFFIIAGAGMPMALGWI